MDWRILTLINSLIALVTLIAVIFDFNAYHKTARPNEGESSSHGAVTEARHQLGHRSINSLSDVRVDRLDSVPPAEFYELFLKATPQEMNDLAIKFNELPPNVRTAGGIGVFFQAWAELDGKAALLGALKLKDADLKRMAVDAVVHSVSPGTAPELAAYIKENPNKDFAEVETRFMDALVERWSGVDPPAAAKFLDGIKDPNSTLVETAAKVAFAWGNVDPAGALAWVRDHPQEADYLFVQVVKGWARADSAAAGAYIAQHSDDLGAKPAAAVLTEQLLRSDPNRAVAWISTLPHSEAKASAEERLTVVWGSKDPATVAHWIQALPRQDQTSVVPFLASVWAGQDWPATRRWIATLGDDLRDGAVSSAIGVSANNVDRTETLPLATSIRDPAERMSTVERIVLDWAASDNAAAEAWIRRSNLRQTEKQELLTKLSEHPEEERTIVKGYAR
jgi:hypothetical protein